MILNTRLKKTGMDKHGKTARILAFVLAVFLVMDQSMLVYAADSVSDDKGSSVTLQEDRDETEEISDDKADNDISAEEPGVETDHADDQADENEKGSGESDLSDEEKDKARAALQNTEPGLKLTENDEPSDDGDGEETDTITVRVSIRNDTYPESEGAPWEGTLVDTNVTVPSDYSMMQAIHKVCQDNNIESWGTDSSYIRMIGGLIEFQGGGGSGWMGTLNDWFVNRGFDQMTIKDGDVIQVEYTCDLGEDLGSSFNVKDKRVSALNVSTGDLSPEFDPDFDRYNLIVPEGTESISIYTTAVNRNYLVKSIVGGKEYERGAKIPISDGTVVTVKCGDPSWPSMNSYEQEDTVKPVVYKINVYEGSPSFLAELTGEKCIPELDRESGIYSAGEKVTVTLRYNESRYQVTEEGVRAYVGGSRRYIQLSEEEPGIYSFTMPGNNVEVKAKCETRYDYPLSVTGSLIGCTMTPDHSDGKYCRGEKVTVTFTLPSGKRLNDSTVRVAETVSEDAVDLKYVGVNKYSFIMPQEDVTVFAESEDITANGLIGYTVKTAKGSIKGEMTDSSRTSRLDLPDDEVKFDLDLDLTDNEALIAVRLTDLFGNITAYPKSSITGISVGTMNRALLGEDVKAVVITRDESSVTHRYTIYFGTGASEDAAETVDSEMIILDASDASVLPYRKTLMTSGVQLYEIDYPTRIVDYTAQTAYVDLVICPTYEKTAESVEIRCKYSEFGFIEKDSSGLSWRYYTRNSIRVYPNYEALDVPVEVDYTLESGETVTKKYLFRITNARYTKQRFKVLSALGNPFIPSSFAVNEEYVPISSLHFEEGAFYLELAPGEYTAASMKKSVTFKVEDDLSRPIITDDVVIQTDVPEYMVTVECPDKDAVYTVRESNTQIEYYVKTDQKSFTLPPGQYDLQAVNDSSHLYSITSFTLYNSDIVVSARRPYLMDPQFVADELDLLEEIQIFDAGEGMVEIYVPEYQSKNIVTTPVIVDNPDGMAMIKRSYYQSATGYTYYRYYVQRDRLEHSMYLRYDVYNKADPDMVYKTSVMELYLPPYSEGAEDIIMPADVRTLQIGFGIDDGSLISGIYGSFDMYYSLASAGLGIPVLERKAGITEEQLVKAGYSVKYTMRYAETENDEMENVWLNWTGTYSAFYRHDNDHDCEVFTTQDINHSGHLFINADISDWGGYADQTVNGYYEVTAWFEDAAGNRSQPATITVCKDGKPPVARVCIDPSGSTGVYSEKPSSPEYTNEAVTIRVEAQDIGQGGLHDEAYSFDGGESWVSQNTITFTEPGSIDISDIWIRDKLGNITAVVGSRFDLDLYTSPTGPRYSGSSWFSGSGGPRWEDGTQGVRYIYVDIEKPGVGVLTSFSRETNEMVLTVKATDTISGLASEAYSFDGGETWQESNKYTVTLGEYAADQIRVRDKAGNITVYDDDYVWTKASFEGEGPVIKKVDIQYGKGGRTGYDGRKWYQSAVLTIEAESDSSEIAAYSFDGITYTESNEMETSLPLLLSAGTISVTDKAGNITTYDQVIDLTNIDSKSPEISSVTFSGNSGAVTREIRAVITALDIGSRNLEYAISPIPLCDFIRGYPSGDLQLEWTDNTDDDQFKISNLGRKYDKTWLADAGDYMQHGLNHGTTLGLKWGIRLWVRDAAGNIGYEDTWCWGGYIDQEGPEISEVTTEYKYFNDASGIVRVYVAATEPKSGSGLAPKAYSFDGGKTWQVSNSTSIPVGASIPAGQIMVRDVFGNISVYNKVVKTTLQDVIKRINDLDPRTAKNRDYKEIIDLYNQLSDREKSKVYNWQDFLDMLGNRKDQDWDDDFGDIGEPDDGGEQGGDQPDPDDPGDDQEGDGEDDGGAGDNDGKPSDGSGNGRGGGKPEARDADGGNDMDTVSVALSNTSTSKTPDVKSKAGQNYREAEIERKGSGGMLSQGMVKLWELMLLIFIVAGAYTYGAQKRYRRYRGDAA